MSEFIMVASSQSSFTLPSKNTKRVERWQELAFVAECVSASFFSLARNARRRELLSAGSLW